MLVWEVVKVYRDHGVSGAKGRDKRPQFDALCRDGTKRQFDVILAWSVDRLGRSLQDLVGFLSEIHALKIDLYLHQQGLDTTTPAGKAMFQMMGVFAEFERAMVHERVRAGLRRAKAEGKRLGRPRVDSATEYAIRKTRPADDARHPGRASRGMMLGQPGGSPMLRRRAMVRTATFVITMLFATSGLAQTACETQAVGKDGKALSGAAKTAFVKKCKKDACEPKAVGSDGKPLRGAAKNSFMKKCQQDA